MLMSWVELHSVFLWSCWWKGGHTSWWHHFQRSLTPIFLSSGPDSMVLIFRRTASCWSSSSNSLGALLLAGPDAVGLLTPDLRWIAANCWYKNSLDWDSSMRKFFSLMPQTCQRKRTNERWHLDCWARLVWEKWPEGQEIRSIVEVSIHIGQQQDAAPVGHYVRSSCHRSRNEMHYMRVAHGPAYSMRGESGPSIPSSSSRAIWQSMFQKIHLPFVIPLLVSLIMFQNDVP